MMNQVLCIPRIRTFPTKVFILHGPIVVIPVGLAAELLKCAGIDHIAKRYTCYNHKIRLNTQMQPQPVDKTHDYFFHCFKDQGGMMG